MFYFDKEIEEDGEREVEQIDNYEKGINEKPKTLSRKYKRIRWEDYPIDRTPV